MNKFLLIAGFSILASVAVTEALHLIRGQEESTSNEHESSARIEALQLEVEAVKQDIARLQQEAGELYRENDPELAGIQSRMTSIENAVARQNRGQSATSSPVTPSETGEVSAGDEEQIAAVVERTMSEIEARQEEERRQKEEEGRIAVRDAIVKGIMDGFLKQKDAIGLTDAQLAELQQVSSDLTLEYLVSQAEGATKDELAVISREGQREAQRIMGHAAYRDFRVNEISGGLRAKMGWTALIVGADETQRNGLTAELENHAQRAVDLRIRIDTEEMPSESRQQLESEYQMLQEQAWRSALELHLTAEQRQRLDDMSRGGKNGR
ncbi:MAG: hypothetical protein NUW37_00150 [Planctomycetes bacterium]|nr:hypothetical protein [Planctomycetota bacterium]